MRTVYIADDGKEFDNYSEAYMYEKRGDINE